MTAGLNPPFPNPLCPERKTDMTIICGDTSHPPGTEFQSRQRNSPQGKTKHAHYRMCFPAPQGLSGQTPVLEICSCGMSIMTNGELPRRISWPTSPGQKSQSIRGVLQQSMWAGTTQTALSCLLWVAALLLIPAGMGVRVGMAYYPN